MSHDTIDLDALCSPESETARVGVWNHVIYEGLSLGWSYAYQGGFQEQLWNEYRRQYEGATSKADRKKWGEMLRALRTWAKSQPKEAEPLKPEVKEAPPEGPKGFLDTAQLKVESPGVGRLQQVEWARKVGCRLVDEKLERLLSNKEVTMPPNLEVIETPFGPVLLAPSATRFFEGDLHTVCFTYNGELPKGRSTDLAVDDKGRAFIRSVRPGCGGLQDGESVWVRVLILTEGSKMKYWAKNDRTGIDIPGSHLFFLIRGGKPIAVDSQTWWNAPAPKARDA